MEASGQLHAPVALPLAKVSQVEGGRRWDKVQNRDGHGGEGKGSLAPLLPQEIEFSVIQSVD
jgi:hypothetical protein